MNTIFISHSDGEAANYLEEVLRNAFPGSVQVFNTSRVASGLAAGAEIGGEVLNRLGKAKLLIWLASPRSVVKSFWMAWELGAASALDLIVLPARCYGLQPEELPLLQGGRFAPDLGERDGMQSLLITIKMHLELREERIGEVLDEMFASTTTPGRLWGVEDDGAITLKVLGRRLLIENHRDEELELTSVTLVEPEEGRKKGPSSVDLRSRFARIRRRERRILELTADECDELSDSVARLRWKAGNGSRHYGNVRILSEGA